MTIQFQLYGHFYLNKIYEGKRKPFVLAISRLFLAKRCAGCFSFWAGQRIKI